MKSTATFTAFALPLVLIAGAIISPQVRTKLAQGARFFLENMRGTR